MLTFEQKHPIVNPNLQDLAGGIPFEVADRVWSYTYSTADAHIIWWYAGCSCSLLQFQLKVLLNLELQEFSLTRSSATIYFINETCRDQVTFCIEGARLKI